MPAIIPKLVSATALSPAEKAKNEILGKIGHDLEGRNVSLHNALFEREAPARLRNSLQSDTLSSPRNVPYSLAAMAMHYDVLSEYDRAAYFYYKAFLSAIEHKAKLALPLIVFAMIISKEKAGDTSQAFDIVKEVSLLWKDGLAQWTLATARAWLLIHAGDLEDAQDALPDAKALASIVIPLGEKGFGQMYLLFHTEMLEGTLQYAKGGWRAAHHAFLRARHLVHEMQATAHGKKFPASFHAEQDLQVAAHLALVEVAQKNIQSGYKNLASVYDEARKAGWPWGQAQASLYLGIVAKKVGDPKVREYFEKSLKTAREVNIPFFQWQAQFYMGCLELADGETDEAVRHLESAVSIIEILRSQVTYDAQKNIFHGRET